MINQDFDRFVEYQKKEKTTYLGNGKRGRNIDPKTNQRGNTDKNVGATGREIE
ncbi:hypothetical protein [Aquibacillus sediminis]|uniref:hypothetical protein n=1 Tax=Aquibacillus sediminis TaxID=2574734 RepID=UPI001485E80D|nr:hypothetical protein [Aquibacillus sediminis]